MSDTTDSVPATTDAQDILGLTQEETDEQSWSSPYGDERPTDAQYLWM